MLRCGTLGLLLLACVSGHASAQSVDGSTSKLELVDQAFANGDCQATLDAVDTLASDTKLTALDTKRVQLALSEGIKCGLRSRDYAKANSYARLATGLPESTQLAWEIRLAFEVDQKQFSEAVETVDQLGKYNPKILSAIAPRTLRILYEGLEHQNNEQFQLRLVGILLAPTFTPPDPFFARDFYRKELARLLSSKNDTEGAKAALIELQDPEYLVAASLDPTLQKVLPAIDFRAAAEKELDRVTTLNKLYPEWLSGNVRVARLLRMIGRPQEALAVLLPLTSRINQSEKFRDLDEVRRWFWNDLGKTYGKLGRFDEAVGAYKAGASEQENGSPNVSQLINLAFLQLKFQRYDEVLKSTDTADRLGAAVSPYGKMLTHFARGCSLFHMNKSKEAEQDLAYAIDNSNDNLAMLIALQLCMNRMDDATSTAARWLNSPETRAQALLAMVEFDPPPESEPKDPVSEKFVEVSSRPEIRAILNRYGGPRRIHLQDSEIQP